MILPTYKEEHILKELIEDYASVKSFVKKKAAVYLKDVQKRGKFIREDEYEAFNIGTGLGNKWYASITFNQTNKVPWIFFACCIVEGEKKSKDYYVVRGLNTDKPYFIKFTTHTLKRMRERLMLDDDFSLESLATHAFVHRETAIASAFMDIKMQMLMGKMEDEKDMHDLSYIVLCNSGVFYAQKTPMNNFIFKTFVSHKMTVEEMKKIMDNKQSKYRKEAIHMYYVGHLHQYYNKWLYDKDILDGMLYQHIGEDEEYELKDTNMVIALKH